MINKSQAHNLYLDSVVQSHISGFRCFIIGVVHMFLEKKESIVGKKKKITVV